MAKVAPSWGNTSVDEAFTKLRDLILSGDLLGGTRLAQSTIADQFHISRQPVRLALLKLQSAGLVTIIPNVGARVTSLDAAELDEVYRIREELEPAAIATSATNLSDRQLETLRDVAAGLDATAPSDYHNYYQADMRFHLLSYEACGRPRMISMIGELWDVAHRYRLFYLRSQSLHERVLSRAEHVLIADSLQRRDGEDASRLLKTHIRRTRLSLSRSSDE